MQRLRDAVQAHAPDVVLCPDPHEPHPDHQATALALLWVMAEHPHPVDVCFYESGGTLAHCSHLVDITAVVACKNEALRAFASQENAQPYCSRIMARDHFRALPLGPQAQAAEGFQYPAHGPDGLACDRADVGCAFLSPARPCNTSRGHSAGERTDANHWRPFAGTGSCVRFCADLSAY